MVSYLGDARPMPQVMGILNVTPDSFFDGGRYVAITDAVDRAARMVAEGGVRLHPDTALLIAAEQERRARPARYALVGLVGLLFFLLLYLGRAYL